jgi:endogenous inhibitor of DNA gyrase (YacG/DUF329 family)
MATVPCPTCGKAVEWSESSRWRPFCGERCRLIDLGDWMSEAHRIAGEAEGGESDREEEGDGPDPKA